MMTLILDLLSRGIGFGFTAAVSPGPFQTLVITETLSHGWRRALPIIFAPLISDIPSIAITLFILGQLPPSVLRILQIVGGLFTLYLAWGMFQRLRTGASLGPAQNASGQDKLKQGVILNMFNPVPYIFWGTINGPIVSQAWGESPVAAIAFVVAFYGIFIGGMAMLVAVFHQARRLDERVIRILLSISLIVMVYLGLRILHAGLWGS